MSDSRLILASASASRQNMLRKAGLSFDIVPARIDERGIEEDVLKHGGSFETVADNLAVHKALSVSLEHPDTYVIGSDQVMIFEDRIFSKSSSRQEAKSRLKSLRGKSHFLVSSVCVAFNGNNLWSVSDRAVLEMADFDDTFLDLYINKAGDSLTACVGCYALEDVGSWLFEKVEGDFFTVLGMPLLPLLQFLKTKGFTL